MTERDLKAKFRRTVKSRMVVTDIEDKYRSGIWDTNLLRGGREYWMEFKWKKTYPVHAESKILFAHYTTNQRNWGRDRVNHLGAILMMVQVGEDYYVLTDRRCLGLGDYNREELTDNSYAVSRGTFFSAGTIIEAMSSAGTPLPF